MTTRISDHLSANDKAFLKAINFTPPLVSQSQTHSPADLYDELMDLAFSGKKDHAISQLGDPPSE